MVHKPHLVSIVSMKKNDGAILEYTATNLRIDLSTL